MRRSSRRDGRDGRVFDRRHALLFGAASVAAVAARLSEADELVCESLRELAEQDCPTPRCSREARATGRAQREAASRRWFVEFHCARCGERFWRSSDALHALVERLEREGACRAIDRADRPRDARKR